MFVLLSHLLYQTPNVRQDTVPMEPRNRRFLSGYNPICGEWWVKTESRRKAPREVISTKYVCKIGKITTTEQCSMLWNCGTVEKSELLKLFYRCEVPCCLFNDAVYEIECVIEAAMNDNKHKGVEFPSIFLEVYSVLEDMSTDVDTEEELEKKPDVKNDEGGEGVVTEVINEEHDEGMDEESDEESVEECDDDSDYEPRDEESDDGEIDEDSDEESVSESDDDSNYEPSDGESDYEFDDTDGEIDEDSDEDNVDEFDEERTD